MDIKLVAESLQESKQGRLDEEMNIISESLLNDLWAKAKETFASMSSKWEALNKDDEKALRQFGYNVAMKTYFADKPEAGQSIIKKFFIKAPVERIKRFLEEAAKVKFEGRTRVTSKDPYLIWKPMNEVVFVNQFTSGGTQGHTTHGGA
jgi:hypothetical protein